MKTDIPVELLFPDYRVANRYFRRHFPKARWIDHGFHVGSRRIPLVQRLALCSDPSTPIYIRLWTSDGTIRLVNQPKPEKENHQ